MLPHFFHWVLYSTVYSKNPKLLDENTIVQKLVYVFWIQKSKAVWHPCTKATSWDIVVLFLGHGFLLLYQNIIWCLERNHTHWINAAMTNHLLKKKNIFWNKVSAQTWYLWCKSKTSWLLGKAASGILDSSQSLALKNLLSVLDNCSTYYTNANRLHKVMILANGGGKGGSFHIT